LVYGGDEREDRNACVASEARARILEARTRLMLDGLPVTQRAISRLTGANRQTVARILSPDSENLARAVHTPIKYISYRSVNQADQISPIVELMDAIGTAVLAPIPELDGVVFDDVSELSECTRCHTRLDAWLADDLEGGYCRSCVNGGAVAR
jgi:hypothetical protein